MEITIVIGIALFAISLFLFTKVINLENVNEELRIKITKRSLFIINSSVALEKLEQYYIDGDASPVSIDGCFVAYHKKNGRLKWKGSGKFYTSKESVRGHDLYQYLQEELFGLEVLNRNYLDFLLKHSELIPQNWPPFIAFWGTVYRQSLDGRCFINCLVKRDGVYQVEKHWLDSFFDENMPAILK